MSIADAPADHRDRQRLVLRLAELGIPTTDTDRQRRVCAVWTNYRVATRSELTKREAGSLVAHLHQPGADVWLRDALAASEPEPEPVPDVAAVDPAACLASWDEQTDDVALATRSATPPHGGTCPCDACNIDPPEDVEDIEGAAPLPGRDWDPADVLADLDDEPEPDPPADPEPVPVEPPCTTPEEVEAAALAAVERFRAQQAAGIVPEPPDRLAIPPRVPVPYTAPDRYCLPARCYCGTCPQYAEQREAAERAYQQELTAARNKDLRRQ